MNLICCLLFLANLFPFLNSSSSPPISKLDLLEKALVSLEKHAIRLKTIEASSFVDLSFISSKVDASVFLGILMHKFVGFFKIKSRNKVPEVAQSKLLIFTKLLESIWKINIFLDDRLSNSILTKKGGNFFDPSAYPQLLHMAAVDLLYSWKRLDPHVLVTVYVYWLKCVVIDYVDFNEMPSIEGALISLSLIDSEFIEPDLKKFIRLPERCPCPSFKTPQQDLRNLVALSSFLRFAPSNLVEASRQNSNFLKRFTFEDSRLEKILLSLLKDFTSPNGKFEVLIFCSKVLNFTTPKECVSYDSFFRLPPETIIISDNGDDNIVGITFSKEHLQYYRILGDDRYFLFTFNNPYLTEEDEHESLFRVRDLSDFLDRNLWIFLLVTNDVGLISRTDQKKRFF